MFIIAILQCSQYSYKSVLLELVGQNNIFIHFSCILCVVSNYTGRVCFEKCLPYLLCAASVKIRPVAILRCTEIHFWDVLWYIWWRLNLCFEWMRSSPAATPDPEQIIAVTSVFQGFVVPFMKLQPDRLQRFCSFPMRSTLLFHSSV